MAINCNEIDSTVTYLLSQFQTCKRLTAGDMQLLVDLISATKNCIQVEGIVQDNMFLEKNLGTYLSTDSIVTLANNLPQYTVDDSQLIIFTGTSTFPSGAVKQERYIVKSKGKGTYGLAATQLILSDFINITPNNYGLTAFTNNYDDLDNLPTIPSPLLESVQPLDVALGTRLQSIGSTNGFFVRSSTNGFNGYAANLTGTGTAAYVGIDLINQNGTFTDATTLMHYSSGYSETALRNNGGLFFTNDMYFTGNRDTSKMIFQLGNQSVSSNSQALQDNVLELLANREVNFPSLTTSIIDAESTGRTAITREWIEAQNFDSLQNLQSVTNEGNFTTNTIRSSNYVEGTYFNVLGNQEGWTKYGTLSLNSLISGVENTAIGYSALRDLEFGSDNTAIGHSALENLKTSSSNTAVGSASLSVFLNGNGNTSLGSGVMEKLKYGNDNIAIGNSSLSYIGYLVDSDNLTIGKKYIISTSGTGDWTTVGASDNNVGTIFQATGTTNGSSDGKASPSVYGNTAVGRSSLLANSTGEYSVGIGYKAGVYTETGTQLPNIIQKSIYIGSNSEPSGYEVVNENVIGCDVQGNGNNTFTYGNDEITTHVFTSGILRAPLCNNALIDGANGKVLVTKEWVNSQSYGGGSKYSETFGDGITTSIQITHNLGTSDLSSIFLRDLGTGEVVTTTTVINDDNNITFTFTTAPTSNQYRVTITA